MLNLLIEHRQDVVAGVSDYVYRLEAGRVVASGHPRDLLAKAETDSCPALARPTRAAQ